MKVTVLKMWVTKNKTHSPPESALGLLIVFKVQHEFCKSWSIFHFNFLSFVYRIYFLPGKTNFHSLTDINIFLNVQVFMRSRFHVFKGSCVHALKRWNVETFNYLIVSVFNHSGKPTFNYNLCEITEPLLFDLKS